MDLVAVKLVAVKCSCCQRTFNYYGEEKEYYFCSSYCVEKETHKLGGTPWKKQGVATYNKAKAKEALTLAKNEVTSKIENAVIPEIVDKPKFLIRKRAKIEEIAN